MQGCNPSHLKVPENRSEALPVVPVSWLVVSMTRRHLPKIFNPEQKPSSGRMILDTSSLVAGPGPIALRDILMWNFASGHRNDTAVILLIPAGRVGTNCSSAVRRYVSDWPLTRSWGSFS